MDRFQDKYRISSHRLRGWDYSSSGHYFITLVVQNRECILGEIEDQKLYLSEFGKIVQEEWYKSFEIRNELILDEFIIMPNHLHALIVLKKFEKLNVNENNVIAEDHDLEAHGTDFNLETHGRASLPPQNDNKSSFHRKPKSISSFIAGFKSATTTHIDDYIDLHNLAVSKYNRENKMWQPNYYDHIIRNEEEYWRIKQYIRNNPLHWGNDKFNEI